MQDTLLTDCCCRQFLSSQTNDEPALADSASPSGSCGGEDQPALRGSAQPPKFELLAQIQRPGSKRPPQSLAGTWPAWLAAPDAAIRRPAAPTGSPDDPSPAQALPPPRFKNTHLLEGSRLTHAANSLLPAASCIDDHAFDIRSGSAPPSLATGFRRAGPGSLPERPPASTHNCSFSPVSDGGPRPWPRPAAASPVLCA
jgi:hypothetical protein